MIYGWRGADHGPIVQLADETFHLTQSFRVPQDVAQLANSIADDALPGMPPLVTGNTINGLEVSGKSVSETVQSLLDELFTPLDIAVLCRTNYSVRAASDELQSARIPVSEQRELKLELKPLMQYLANPRAATRTAKVNAIRAKILSHDFLSLASVEPDSLNEMRIQHWLSANMTVRDIFADIIFSDESFEEEIVWWNNYFGGRYLQESLDRLALLTREAEVTSGVRVMTIHQAKGLEFPAVVAIGGDAPHVESILTTYVQVTRPQQRLVVLDWSDKPSYLAQKAKPIIFRNLQENLAKKLARS